VRQPAVTDKATEREAESTSVAAEEAEDPSDPEAGGAEHEQATAAQDK
jgi:hypothetical protein